MPHAASDQPYLYRRASTLHAHFCSRSRNCHSVTATIASRMRSESTVPSASPLSKFCAVWAKYLGRLLIMRSPLTMVIDRDGILAAGLSLLHGRTTHRAIREKHATIARPWFQPLAATFTVIEKLASICRHLFGCLMSALWASNNGVLNHVRRCRLIRKLFPTTLTLEIAIAPAATIGLRNPSAASGIAATL